MLNVTIKSLRYYSISRLTPVSWMLLAEMKREKFVTHNNRSNQSIGIFALVETHFLQGNTYKAG